MQEDNDTDADAFFRLTGIVESVAWLELDYIHGEEQVARRVESVREDILVGLSD